MPSFIPVTIKTSQSEVTVGKLAIYDKKLASGSILAFQYDRQWLQIGFSLGSDLPLTESIQYPTEHSLFKFMMDHGSMPWMNQSNAPFSFHFDAHDAERFSALRFTDKKVDFPYSSAIYSKKLIIEITRCAESGLRNTVNLSEKESNILSNYFSDLGGTRPKALICSQLEPHRTKILRLPLSCDSFNVPQWMALCRELAESAGIRVVSGLYANTHYIEERFDRENGKPRMCLSAQTLLRNKTATWLDIADILNQQGTRPKTDLEELYRRLIFDMAILNQHSTLNRIWFYREANGWRLAPLYAPLPSIVSHSVRLMPIALSGSHFEADTELATELSRYFGLKSSRAREIQFETFKITSGWRELARKYGVCSRDLALLEASFR